MTETKNQEAWTKINEKTKFVAKIKKYGKFIISSTMIKKISNREPRLMAKLDHYTNQPKIFKDNDISILPISRLDYELMQFNSYNKVEYSDDLVPVDTGSVEKYQSIDLSDVKSEDSAIIVADIYRLLASFIEEEVKFTLRGKFGTESFDFEVVTNKGPRKVKVNSTGAELDAGFEGGKLYLLEAKIGKVEDFNIRQLYYPYRYWLKKVKKEVVPIFFSYSDKVFSFWEYDFKNPTLFNSISLRKHKNFLLSTEVQSIPTDILEVKNFVASDSDFAPFPQANDFEKVINLIELIDLGENTKENLADFFSFDPRQSDYYLNAAKYLGLADKKQGIMFLTKFGKEVLRMPRSKMHASLIREIFKRKVFYESYKIIEEEDYSIEDIVEIMKKVGVLKSYSIKTFKRRAQTIVSWCNWIRKAIAENNILDRS